MSAPPLRRRDHGANYDYYPQPAQYAVDPRYYQSGAAAAAAPYPAHGAHGAYEQQAPPRRHKSERRRPRTPEPPVDDGHDRSRRHRRRGDYRDEPPVIMNPAAPPPGSDRRRHKRGGSPPPSAPSPPVPEGARRGRDRDLRDRRQDRNSMPPPPRREMYDHHGAMPIREHSRSDRPPPAYHPHRGEPEPRPRRRSRHASPPREARPPPRAQTFPDPPPHRGGNRRYYDDDPPPPRRRPRSQGRAGYGPPDVSPPREPRGRPPPSANREKSAPQGANRQARRNSMPATIMKQGKNWWANPMIQAGARNAFTAGAQAALRSKNDSGPWMGAKGAKVATAALGAAFIDGVLGQKHPDSARHDVLKEGYNVALDDIDNGRMGPKRRHR